MNIAFFSINLLFNYTIMETVLKTYTNDSLINETLFANPVIWVYDNSNEKKEY